MYMDNKNGNYPTNELSITAFSSMDDLDSYANKRHYVDERLCFALAWKEFNPDENIFQLYIRMNYGDVPDTRLPQNEYEESKYDQNY